MRWLALAAGLGLAGCAHGCPTIDARLEVRGPPLSGDAFAPARARLARVPRGARAWHRVMGARRGLVEDVRAAYRAAGYPDAGAVARPPVLEGDRVRVVVDVEAGARLRVASVRALEGDDPIAVPSVEGLRAGAWFDESALHAALTALEVRYQGQGYASALVDYTAERTPAGVEVTLRVEPGVRYRIARVELTVAPERRPRALDPAELDLETGAPFAREPVERALERLRSRYPGRAVHWRIMPGDPQPERATIRFVVDRP